MTKVLDLSRLNAHFHWQNILCIHRERDSQAGYPTGIYDYGFSINFPTSFIHAIEDEPYMLTRDRSVMTNFQK